MASVGEGLNYIIEMSWVQHDFRGRRIRKNTGGYREIYYPEHPHCDDDGYVLIHRMVMENHLQRYLDPVGEVVHHVNEDKTCNELWNLFLCTPQEHTLIHRLGKKHTRSGRANMSEKHRQIAPMRKRDFSGRFLPDDT